MKTVIAGLVSMFMSTAAMSQEGTHAATSAAHAAAEGGHEAPAGVLPTIEQGIFPMLVSIVVFCVVLVILSAKVWPAISQALADRERKIREEIESAEMARQQAKDALEQYQQSLAQARAEAQKMIDQTRQQQAALAAELKAKADADLTAMRQKAMQDIEAAKRAAVAELYQESASLATAIAGKILRRSVTPGDTKALVEESVQQLASLKN